MVKVETSKYKVERHVMFFAKGEVVLESKLLEYFTQKAVESFIKYGYLIKTNKNK